jgi:hypothetical protein
VKDYANFHFYAIMQSSKTIPPCTINWGWILARENSKEARMSMKPSTIRLMCAVLILTSLSCGLFGRASEQLGAAADIPLQLIRQWASSATASSEYGNPDWAAHQATGAPDTPECGDLVSAWASYDQYTVEWLEVGYATPVVPSEVNIY